MSDIHYETFGTASLDNGYRVKVSATGWLCIWYRQTTRMDDAKYGWLPLIKLTGDQIDEWLSVTSEMRENATLMVKV